ncbi:MAG: acetyl/propionyl/methylcrotonyl-CoA carboxylase subunit alpha [Rubrivivax sp.]|nr:acetyl/propionyl/methylcrotonyl-CoA carboxylase subunit alpha [Rubrivivax sp.]
MFKKILIANRGEIACRVIVTARKMGIATVAVYSEADADARHVDLADEAVAIGPAPSRDSYLVADKIIAACKSTGAEAVHPGYGFLSENEAFARRLEEEGIVFIGPKHASIAAMGDKIASKKLALAAGVNTIPGWNDAIDTPEQAVQIARDIGYPVMIKASAGGGGKGLRVAFGDKEAHEGFASCRNEAKASFGDDRVFIEKYVEQPRHIEIQVLGDAHGHMVYLQERECSIQRRHQKVIEEAPSPFISDDTRRAMGAQAVALAKAVDYQSAGTVEFVVGRDQSFYFLEMNTRLQVEHPVTECITGIDLVEQMILVAAGKPLAFTQEQIPRRGWAMECRINAEDPFRGFLPSTGRLVRYIPPPTTMEAAAPVPETGGVRVDTGVCEGGQIPMYYDSMIAKLIVHGADRADAIARMREALNGFVIRGVSSNIPFQAGLLAHPKFAAGDFHTGFIAEQYADGFKAESVPHEDPDFLLALAAAANRRYLERAAGISGQLPGHGVRVGEHFTVVLKGPGGEHRFQPVTIVREQGIRVTLGDKHYTIDSDWHFGGIRAVGQCNGKSFTAQVERHGLWTRVQHNGLVIEAMVMRARAAELLRLMPFRPPQDMSKFLLSPMPGLLVNVAVQVGDVVQVGARLAVVEAMKMENILVATHDGVVKEVLASPSQSLAVDQPILAFE